MLFYKATETKHSFHPISPFYAILNMYIKSMYQFLELVAGPRFCENEVSESNTKMFIFTVSLLLQYWLCSRLKWFFGGCNRMQNLQENISGHIQH